MRNSHNVHIELNINSKQVQRAPRYNCRNGANFGVRMTALVKAIIMWAKRHGKNSLSANWIDRQVFTSVARLTSMLKLYMLMAPQMQ
mmetsp:Transcript_10876/g.25011  ORF Transcript_10876/g.25011 Transcript_10876/m.25011 type:complete len:87 (-) Transcript_10876:408-668(-)